MHTPTDGAEKQAAMAERFNSELAFFLLVAEDHMWWEVSWFLFGLRFMDPGWNGRPGLERALNEFFPQAKCSLGPPAGAYVKGEHNT